MKEDELRTHAICSVCGGRIGHTLLPIFWTISIEHYTINMGAIRRQDGLTALLDGHARLAQVMGTDAEMAKRTLGPITMTICATCAAGDICLMQLMKSDPEEDKA